MSGCMMFSDFIEYVLNLFRHGLWRILFGLGFQFFGTQYFAFESSVRIFCVTGQARHRSCHHGRQHGNVANVHGWRSRSRRSLLRAGNRNALRVVVILRLAQAEDERSHIVPQLRVFAVFTCQSHGVANVSRSSIIGRQDKVYTFRPAGDIAEFTFEFTEVPGCRTDVLLGWCIWSAGKPRCTAVSGIICISPRAPAHDTASGSKPDSW